MPITSNCAEMLKEFGAVAQRARDVFLSAEWQSVYTLSAEKRARAAQTMRDIEYLAATMAADLEAHAEESEE